MLEEALFHYFHYRRFRLGQKEVVQSLLEGNDTLAVLPTGTGKSLCYQLPGYLLEGTVLVVTPLISLMEDQLFSLQKLKEKRATILNGNLTRTEKDYILHRLATYKFLFLSPEMLLQTEVLSRLAQIKISLFVIDEAHCISQWGIDFRPEYGNLAQAKKQLDEPLTLALTATATETVQQEIAALLLGQKQRLFCYSVDRPNISLSVIESKDKVGELKEWLSATRGPALVYCATRKKVEDLYAQLKDYFAIGYYHGGLDSSQRKLLQNQFINNQLQFLICTNAFGMGVDKPDIRRVIHFDLPDSIENYLQEIGRSGRDGHPSDAILLYQENDESIHYFMQQQAEQEREQFTFYLQHSKKGPLSEIQQKWFKQVKQIGAELFVHQLRNNEQNKRQKLEKMLAYIHYKGCRRQFILAYFHEQLQSVPTNCCDYHGFSPLKQSSSASVKSFAKESWQSILLKMF